MTDCIAGGEDQWRGPVERTSGEDEGAANGTEMVLAVVEEYKLGPW